VGFFDEFIQGAAETARGVGDALKVSATHLLDVGEQQLGVVITNLGVEESGQAVETGFENRDPREITPGNQAAGPPRERDSNMPVGMFEGVPPSLLVGGGVAVGVLALVLVAKALK